MRDCGGRSTRRWSARWLGLPLDPPPGCELALPSARFRLGRYSTSTAARALVAAAGLHVRTLIERHGSGDWGEVSRKRRRANDRALQAGGELLSRYVLRSGSVYIRTTGDREVTELLARPPAVTRRLP